MTEVVQEQPSELEFAELVTAAIEAYENDRGDYHEHEHRHLARKYGYNDEEFGQLWLDAAERVKLARAERQLANTKAKQVEAQPKSEPAEVKFEPKPTIYRRIAISDHVVNRAGASFILPTAQPKAEHGGLNAPKGRAAFQEDLARVAPEIKRRAMLRFNPAKNPFNQNGFENARIALGLMEFDCALDLFHHKPVIRGKHAWLGGDGFEDLDNVALKLRQLILDEFDFDPKEKGVFDALRARCLDHAFDPLLDYLDGLQWDGKRRLDRWLSVYCKADDTPLNRAFGRKTLIAAVRRARHPGCKFDYLLVLEGDQGIGKSTVVKILAGDDYYSDKAIIGCDTREQQESIQGVWLYEIAELQGLSKVDMNWMKMFLSRTHDKARPAFGRSVVDRPRRGIMIGTTNDDAYLRDATGNRRWWQVKLHGKIDLSALQRHRDQLLAEAVAVEATGEGLVIPERLWGAAAIEQQARMEVDAWLEPISDALCILERKRANMEGSFSSKDADKNCAPEFRVSTAYLLGNVLCIEESRRSQRETKRLADVMRTLGWRLAQYPIKVGRKTCRAYTKPQLEET
jgi:predicted P-loop ATPase